MYFLTMLVARGLDDKPNRLMVHRMGCTIGCSCQLCQLFIIVSKLLMFL